MEFIAWYFRLKYKNIAETLFPFRSIFLHPTSQYCSLPRLFRNFISLFNFFFHFSFFFSFSFSSFKLFTNLQSQKIVRQRKVGALHLYSWAPRRTSCPESVRLSHQRAYPKLRLQSQTSQCSRSASERF